MNRMLTSGDRGKAEGVRQWTADPCGPAIVATPGTRAAIEELLAGQRAESPWVAQVLRYKATEGLDVLDVGCGQGIDLVEYARAGASAIGIDLTPRHVELARSHVRALGLTAKVVQADAECLPFADSSFDLVSSNGVLHHTPDMPAALREIRRVLRPGGQARIVVYNRRSFHYWLSQVLLGGILERGLLTEGSMDGVLARSVERTSIGARPLVRAYSPSRLRRMLADAGLVAVGTSVWGFDVEDTPLSTWLGRHTRLLDSPRVRERIGRIGGWYVIGSARRGR
jgi:ubiquinone/menaquinone biosynthesis C-methylase UbiE